MSLLAMDLQVSYTQILLAFRFNSFFGPIAQVEVLRIGLVDAGSKPFTPQGKTGNWAYSLDSMALWWGVVYGERMSQPFLPNLMWRFSHLPDV